MPAIKTIFVCQSCGYQSPKWLGRCPECQQWNSLIEDRMPDAVATQQNRGFLRSGVEAPQKIKDIAQSDYIRTKTNISELDRVLGGGVVLGSVILIGGEPGIGKSTLLLQICDVLAKNKKVLYVSGEESKQQIKLRFDRLGISCEGLYIATETELSAIIEHIDKLSPETVVIDSIQVLHSSDFSQGTGSVSQIKECAGALTALAKYKNFSLFIVGHVTKEGSIAGPKILEHMVDCVIYFEGQSQSNFRILRSVKNRFGPTNEIGVFHMTGKGLVEVANPSSIFLNSRANSCAGSAVVSTLEGTRPILVEIQALVSHSNFTLGRQRAIGVDLNRLLLLLAVLEKKLGLRLSNYDVFVSAAGGIEIDEPASDLAICAAVVSSYKNKPVSSNTVFIAEVGLNGELRSSAQLQARVNEASRLGFKRCVLPASDIKQVQHNASMALLGAENIEEALKGVFES